MNTFLKKIKNIAPWTSNPYDGYFVVGIGTSLGKMWNVNLATLNLNFSVHFVSLCFDTEFSVFSVG